MTRRIVVDASVLVAALMADGRARHALTHTEAFLYVPPRIFEEVEAHAAEIAGRAGVPEAIVRGLIEELAQHLDEVPSALIEPWLPEARERVAAAEAEGDEDYVALAIALDAEVWTYDHDFERIEGILTISTKDVLDA